MTTSTKQSKTTASTEVEHISIDTDGAHHVVPFWVRAKLNNHKLVILGLLILSAVSLALVSTVRGGAGQPNACGDPKTAEQTVLATRVPAQTGHLCGASTNLPMLTLPRGMVASVFACNLFSPRELTVTPRGIPTEFGDVIFVGSRKFRVNSTIYALIDSGRDGAADEIVTFDEGLDQPNGVEWLDGALYVATARQLLRYTGVLEVLAGTAQTTRRTILNAIAFPALPSLQWHYLRAHEGVLYASISAGCDHCVPVSTHAASIVSLPTHTCYKPEVYVRGVRFSVGFAFGASDADLSSTRLVFTNNAHDSIDGDRPLDTINKVDGPGANFGFPYCYTTGAGDLNATTSSSVSSHAYYQDQKSHADRTALCTRQYAGGRALGSNLAPLGVSYLDDSTLLIAERGAWGGPAVGHRISRISAQFTDYEPFISGFINASTGVSWGRPVDVQVNARDGAIFVSDDKANAVYRFVRAPSNA